MAVVLNQNPTTYNLAYGTNAVTLSNLGIATKFVLRILDGATVISDLRQAANQNGHAIFDIQNILQSYVNVSKKNIETTEAWTTSAEETFEYTLEYGSQVDDEAPVMDGAVSGFVAIGGKKVYFDTPWADKSKFQPIVFSDTETLGDCTGISQRARALSDWTYYVNGSTITDGIPFIPASNDRVYIQNVRQSDNITLSFLQSIVPGSPTPDVHVNGVAALRAWFYNKAGTLLGQTAFENIQPNGGGPNVDINDGATLTYPYHVVTAGVGPANTEISAYMPSGTHHWYIGTPVWTTTECAELLTYPNLTEDSAWYLYRYNLIEDNCSDFTPIQVSWLNSLGFRDFFTFQKKNERTLNISRNEYLKDPNDYNGSLYQVTIGDRGYTTYSQTIEESWTANTRFLYDYEASFLESLFTSADIRVRGGDGEEWYPAQILNTQYVQKTYRKDRLFQYELQFKLSHNLKAQRG